MVRWMAKPGGLALCPRLWALLTVHQLTRALLPAPGGAQKGCRLQLVQSEKGGHTELCG